MSTRRLFPVLAALLFAPALFAEDASLEEVRKLLAESGKNLKSYSMTSESTMQMDMGDTYKMSSTTTSVTDVQMEGDAMKMRSTTDSSSKTIMGKDTTETKTTALTVSDGETMWMLSETDGAKTCMRYKAQTTQDVSPTSLIDGMKEMYDIKRVADAQIDGADCFVLEMTMKPMAGMPSQGKSMTYLRKDCGVMVKQESFDAAGKPSMTTKVTKLDLAATFPADHFKFVPPAGVEVVDGDAAGGGAIEIEEGNEGGEEEGGEEEGGEEEGGEDEDE